MNERGSRDRDRDTKNQSLDWKDSLIRRYIDEKEGGKTEIEIQIHRIYLRIAGIH